MIYNSRAKNDLAYVHHLQLVCKGIATVEQQAFFKTRTFDSLDCNEIKGLPALYMKDTLYVASTKILCAQINRTQVNRLVNEQNKPLYLNQVNHRYASKQNQKKSKEAVRQMILVKMLITLIK